MRFRVLCVCCLLPALVVTAAGGLVAATEPSGATPQLDAGPPRPAGFDPFVGQAGLDPTAVVMQFHVRENGDAVARTAYHIRLDDPNSTAAFERFERQVAANTSRYTRRFARRVRETAATAENATGRPMAVENVTVRTTTEQLSGVYGVVTYSFTWHGFAATDDDRIEIGDALGGLYLDNRTRLLVSWPDGYEATELASTVHEERENSAVWVGPRYFGPDGPEVVLTPAGASSGLGTAVLVVSGLGLLVLAGGVALWLRSGRDASPWPVTGSSESRGMDGAEASPADGSAVTTGGAGDSTRAETGVPDATPGVEASEAPSEALDPEKAGESATTGVSGGGSAGDAPGDSTEAAGESEEADSESGGRFTDEPPELLSNEERVLQILERRDGRVKQQEVVGELDWSAAKVSRVVGDLRESGRIESFRLGNENVLSLPEEDEEP